MRVLGVDPGTVATGWGIVDESSHRLTFVAGGVIRPRGELPRRLAAIHARLGEIMAEFTPSSVSIEKSFVGANIQSAFRLGEARGAIIVAASLAEIDIAEYSPAQIKVSVAGNGRAAKEQMQAMVAQLLGISPDLPSDQADALGAAICHLHSRHLNRVLEVEKALGGRIRRGGRSAGMRR